MTDFYSLVTQIYLYLEPLIELPSEMSYFLYFYIYQDCGIQILKGLNPAGISVLPGGKLLLRSLKETSFHLVGQKTRLDLVIEAWVSIPLLYTSNNLTSPLSHMTVT